MGNECCNCQDNKKKKREPEFNQNNNYVSVYQKNINSKLIIKLNNNNIIQKTGKIVQKNKSQVNKGKSKINLPEVQSQFLNGQREDTLQDDTDNQIPTLLADRMSDKIISTDPSVHNQFQIVFQQFQKSKSPFFQDPTFPPSLQSLTKDGNMQIANRCVWRRAQEFALSMPQTQNFSKSQQYNTFSMQGDQQQQQQGIRVFSGKIEPGDIKQGSLGDCYFLSSLSALAERPNLISRLFETQDYNEQGIYCVWLCIDGEWKQVVIDDFFPCLGKNQGPAFSKSHGPELWVLLMEKAYAKCFGAYHKIESGLTGSAIRDLTGSPSEFKITTKEEPDKLWGYMLENDRKKFILTAGSQADERGVETQQDSGIVSSHAYAILDMQEVVNSQNQTERIIQLRNPWGSKEWNGDWSDSSSKWTPELRKRLNVEDRNDGTFWMPLSAFIQEFNDVTINRLHENYMYSSKRIAMNYNNNNLSNTVKKQPKFTTDEQSQSFNIAQELTGKQQSSNIAAAVVVEFEVLFNNTHGYISINQKDKRHFNKEANSINYDYSFGKLIICRGTRNEVKKYVSSKGQTSRNIDVECEQLNKGSYLAYIEIDWPEDLTIEPEFVLSAYSSTQINFSKNPELLSLAEANEIMDQIMAITDPHEEDALHIYEEDNNICRYTDQLPGYVFFNYVNRSENSTLQEQMTIKDRENLQICLPYTNSDVFNVEVLPQSKKIVKFKNVPSGEGYSYSYSFTYQVILSDNNLIQKIFTSPEVNKKQRTLQGNKIDVWIYSYFYSGGVAIYYDNKTNQQYNEKLKFTLTNLVGVNVNTDNEIEIKIQPKGNFLIKLKEIDPTQNNTNFSSKVSFYLSQPESNINQE